MSGNYVEPECRETAVLNCFAHFSFVSCSFVHNLKSAFSISHGKVFDKVDIFPCIKPVSSGKLFQMSGKSKRYFHIRTGE